MRKSHNEISLLSSSWEARMGKRGLNAKPPRHFPGSVRLRISVQDSHRHILIVPSADFDARISPCGLKETESTVSVPLRILGQLSD